MYFCPLFSRCAVAVLFALLAAEVWAQVGGNRTIDPRSIGLDLPPGPVLPGDGQAVTTSDDNAQPVVGRVHVRIGDGAAILLPDGQLVSRRFGQFSPTERKFDPLNKDQISTRLATEFPGFKTRSTVHYVYAYNASEEFELAASRILETMLPGVKGYVEASKTAVHNPQIPLVVVMFRTEAEFQRYRRMPDGVVAYYHPLSNRVFMFEQSRLAEVRPDLAVQQSISTIAHEGVHQILHNIGVQQRLSLWPMWLSEGLAEFFAPTSTGSRLRWKGAGQVNDLRMFELEQYLKSKAAQEPSGELVEHTVLAAQLTSTGYASAWALTHYLAKNRRTEFNALLHDCSRLGPLEGATDVIAPGVVRSNRELFSKHFGDDFKELEARLVLHLKKLPYTDPFQDASHFVATLVASSGKRRERSANTFHSLPLALKWLRDSLEKIPTEQRGAAQSTIRAFPNRPQAEAFAQEWLQGR